MCSAFTAPIRQAAIHLRLIDRQVNYFFHATEVKFILKNRPIYVVFVLSCPWTTDRQTDRQRDRQTDRQTDWGEYITQTAEQDESRQSTTL